MGPPFFRSPYIVTVSKLFFHWKIQSRFKGKPWFGDLFTPNHESRALEISVKIVEEFVKTAQERNVIPVLLVLPSILDFQYFSKRGKWLYQPLIDQLAKNRIQMHNMGSEFLQGVELENACSLFEWGAREGIDDCGGHYSDRGYTILGEAIADLLLREHGREFYLDD